MIDHLNRRELARLAVGVVGAAALGGTEAMGLSEVDAPGGRQLLRTLLGPDPEGTVAAARRLARRSERGGGRVILAVRGRRRLVSELTASGYRLTVWSPRLGGVTIEGDRETVRRVAVNPRRRGAGLSPYDTAIATSQGVVLITSSMLAQRELAPKLIPRGRLPEVYQRLGRSLLERLERTDGTRGKRR